MEIYNKLFEMLTADALILTANKRLIGFLHKNYATYQQTKKKSVWFTPQILTLENWLTLEWEKQQVQNNIFSYHLLSKYQECVIWQSIIENSADAFLMRDAIALAAQQAWQLHHHWQLDYQLPYCEHEPYTWKIWAENFIAFSQAHTCIDLATATTRLIDLFKKRILRPPQRIFLIGFDEIHPQHKKLFQTMEESGCRITTFIPSCPRRSIARRFVAENAEVECQIMAQWAYQHWQAGKQSIACVLPQLLETRSQVVDSFTEVWMSSQHDTSDPLPFNVAAGKKLSEFPMIQTAFNIFQLRVTNPFNRISLLLRSPYLAYAEEEQAQRSQLDIYLRRHMESRIDLKRLAQISQQQRCPQLSQVISHLIPFSYSLRTQQYPSTWAQHFAKKLQLAGWPGQRCLLSEEFQLLEHWSECLSEFSRLDFILGKISDEVAFEKLHDCAVAALFQAKTLQDTPIHVLGLLDTAGLCFDNLWVMGLDDHTWPATAHANPFIPHALQRVHQLPHSSNQREFYFSSLITQRWLTSAGNIIFSHASQCNEQTRRPSALIASVPSVEKNDLGLLHYSTRLESIWASQRWEYYVDEYAPPVARHELTSSSSQLLKRQAACPFQAFARVRLDANFYPVPQAGLNAIDRGILLHDVIALFWNVVGDQATLLKQSEQTLQTLIMQAIDEGIAQFSKKRPMTFQPRFLEIERERLQRRLMPLFERDKRRIPFTKVAHEKKQNLILGQLVVNLRMDRLDELEDGSTLIIDYKTGVPRKLNWFEERLDEPQLPLYCLSYPSAKGFAIIHIRSNTLTTQGCSEKENGLSEVLPFKKDRALPQTWPALLAYWKHSLTTLAEQFQAGFAKVDPKHGPATCRLCNLKLVCRINHHVR